MLTRKSQVPTYPVIDWNRPLFRPTPFDDVVESFFAQMRSVSAGPRFAGHDGGPDGDVKKAEAKIQDGVLTLMIPRRPETQPRQIPINKS